MDRAASILSRQGQVPVIWLVSPDGEVELAGVAVPDAFEIQGLDRVDEAFLAIGRTPTYELAVLRSVDGGSWERVESPFPSDWIAEGTFSAEGRLVAQVVSLDSSVAEVWTTTNGIQWSQLPGLEWMRFAHGEIGWVAWKPDGSQAWFSEDGGTWQPLAEATANPEITEGHLQQVAVGSRFLAIWSIASIDFGPGWLWIGTRTGHPCVETRSIALLAGTMARAGVLGAHGSQGRMTAAGPTEAGSESLPPCTHP